MEFARGGAWAAVFTQDAFRAAPVIVAKDILAATMPLYLLINFGNAMREPGDSGLRAAGKAVVCLRQPRSCAMDQVRPFSTGHW